MIYCTYKRKTNILIGLSKSIQKQKEYIARKEQIREEYFDQQVVCVIPLICASPYTKQTPNVILSCVFGGKTPRVSYNHSQSSGSCASQVRVEVERLLCTNRPGCLLHLFGLKEGPFT